MAKNREERQDLIIRHIADGGTIEEALAQCGIHRSTVQGWRNTDPTFKRRWYTAKQSGANQRAAKDAPSVYDPGRKMRQKPGYEQWLREYLGFPVPAHLQPVATAVEDRTNLVVIVLGPPGCGKDTTGGNFVLHESCDGHKRVAWIMESEKFSIRRMNERLGPYLTEPKTYDHTPDIPGGTKPTRNLIEDYGPFQWEKGMKYPDGTPVERPRWSAEEKYFITSRAPEADPNLWATGIQGALYGSRVDLMVISDPFTTENQKSPTARFDQMQWLRGTAKSRLDEGGRLLILGTRVASYDNYGVLLDEFTKGARVIYEDGYYQKWSNGTATVIFPALLTDENGEDVSYWPERFPLHGRLIEKDGTSHRVDDLDDEAYMALSESGARRERGLYEIRDADEATFQTLYQQNPPASSSGDFTEAILNHCDDPTRTLGVTRAGEVLVLGIDPARSGGAAWVLWGWDAKAGTATVVDCFFGEKLGMVGLREKLLVDPTLRYLPRYLCYEMNYEASVLDHPDVKDAMQSTATELVRHRTDRNRSDSDIGLPGMVFKMREGMIRFPTATADDERRMRQLKDHFLAWDIKTATQRTRSGQFKHIPDDLAMAAWIGFVKVREISERSGRIVPQRRVNAAVQAAWGTRRAPSQKEPVSEPITDLAGFWTEADGRPD